MSEPSSNPGSGTPPPQNITTSNPPTVSSVTTRNMSAQQAQQARAAESEANAAEDSERGNNEKRKDRTVPPFKGKCTKMNGNVFELPEEGRSKSNQFTETMTALYRYALDYVQDLDPLFASPPAAPKVPQPAAQAPMIESPPGSGKYIQATRDYCIYSPGH